MNFIFNLLCLLLYFVFQLETYIAEKVRYIATERPNVVYFNKKFIRNFSVTSRRYSRDDFIYYINIYTDILLPIGNNASVDLYFYEFQANRYRRTYVELHAKMCDFTEKSSLFGDTLQKAMASGGYSCPFKPGPRNFSNMTIPIKSIPESFPFRQGRLICNLSITHSGAISKLAEATIDLEVKFAGGNKFTNKGS